MIDRLICRFREGRIGSPLDIETRKARLNAAAEAAGSSRFVWYGDTGERCSRCRIQAPAGYLLAFADTDVTGCLRCLEHQAHLFAAGLENMPHDLIGSGQQSDALRRVAEEFRHHMKAAQSGRVILSRAESRKRWQTARDDAADLFDGIDVPFETRLDSSRWSRDKRSTTTSSQARLQRRSRAGRSQFGDRLQGRVHGGQRIHRQQSRVDPSGRQWQAWPSGSPELAASEALGLAGRPSREEVMAAFRQCALLCHPDHGGDAERFREIVGARETLLAALAVGKRTVD